MSTRIITADHLCTLHAQLISEEKSPATIQKYMRDAQTFLDFAGNREITKTLVIDYKAHLLQCGYTACSINSMLAGLNSLLNLLGWNDCRVKNIRYQRQLFCTKETALSKEEYLRLIAAAQDRPQLQLVIQTLGATGIRVSELQYFTVESVKNRCINVNCKGKLRKVLIPESLRQLLLNYAQKESISNGCIFVTRSKNPLDRSNIWSQMKGLCEKANVDRAKIYPHNLRKLFARTFYRTDNDICKLADVLGHGCIETTRIYIMDTGTEHNQTLESLGLVI